MSQAEEPEKTEGSKLTEEQKQREEELLNIRRKAELQLVGKYDR